MAEKRTLTERIANLFFGVPAVAQLWARQSAQQSGDLLKLDAEIPFTPLRKPLAECRVALITTGGIHLPSQPPFDMENPDGDPGYREIPGDVDPAQITITHKYYNHEDADRDLNVIFPLDHMRDLVAKGVLGSLAPRHFGFMGHIDGPQCQALMNARAPEVAERLRADQVDIALLTPA